jgi:prepilin-type N-terminal cleavage/methylation domain-containing protein
MEKTAVRYRQAFTLVELIIVMAIILLLATLAVAFFPDISTSDRATRGASSVQSWLLTAKQRAKRDGLPTGIRFLVYTTTIPSGPQAGTYTFCNQMEYIQQPPDFAVGRVFATSAPSATPMTVGLNTNIRTSQYTASGFEDEYDVQNGDYFELYGGGFIRQINTVSAPMGSATSKLTMLSNSDSYPGSSTTTSPTVITTPATNPGPNYRIIRQPRELPGEPILTLPYNIAIDLNTGTSVGGVSGNTVTFSNPPKRTSLNTSPVYQYYEIVFSPTGSVIGSGNQNPYDGQIYLWVRDITVANIASDPQQGVPTIISVQTRTGTIAAYPVAPITSTYNNDPFYYSKAARSSGL